MAGSGTPTGPDTRAHRNALARRRRLLNDEHYGPLYARARPRLAAAVDARIEAGDTAGAKRLLDEAVERRREANRARYRARLEAQVVAHMTRQLAGLASYQQSTIEEGVALMTYPQLRATLRWNTNQLRAAARSGIRPDLSQLPRNPWWYH